MTHREYDLVAEALDEAKRASQVAWAAVVLALVALVVAVLR